MEKNYFQESDAFEIIDIGRIFTIIQRSIWLFVIGFILCASSAYFISRQQTPVYEATTNILVTRNSQQKVGDGTELLNINQLVQTYMQILSMTEFLDDVSQRTNYTVTSGDITTRSLPNTQIIVLKVQDDNPEAAAKIADAIVVALIERNETLQAGRYNDAEKALDLQISDVEAKIADVQDRLDEAKANAFAEQLAQAKVNIDSTVSTINIALPELDRLDTMSWEQAHYLLWSAKSNLVRQQALLDVQIADRVKLETKLTSDARAQTDPNFVKTIQANIVQTDTKIEATRQLIIDLQKEIDFLTPLDSPEGFDATVVEKKNFLATQQSLLASYKNVYTSLLSTEEVKRTTNEIDNLTKDLALYQQIYLGLLNNRETVKQQRMQNTPTVQQVSPAIAGKDPVKPRILFNTLLGGLAGLIFVGGVVVVREMVDTTIKSRDQIEKLLGTQVIGYIVNIKNESNSGEGIYVARFPRSPIADSFRSLRGNLEFSGTKRSIKTILVTSSGPSEGKTTISANLAAVLAQSGKKVVLVDADLRRPRIHQYTGVSNQTGLVDLINTNHESDLSNYIQQIEMTPQLGILPSGNVSSNLTADLLGSEKMRNLLRLLSDSNDYVVIDAAPMLIPDTQVLLGVVDGVLLVVMPGKTRSDVLHDVNEQIKHSNAVLLGVIFNRLLENKRLGYSGYSYPYYYNSNYYYVDGVENAKGQQRKKRF